MASDAVSIARVSPINCSQICHYDENMDFFNIKSVYKHEIMYAELFYIKLNLH